jgi:hypothetical protein
MTALTLKKIETAVCADKTLTPELAGLILNLFTGKVAARLKPSEVARMLNTNSETVRRWNWDGTLEAIEVADGGYRYHPADVLAVAIARGTEA